ncbi:hypothetical protein [Cupriavidus basilensis]|jgi:hypothetical protein|nr:hypothetical protein [Cupriavidus basilensis]MCP3024608.1 hypothetical protein [Cupriavidus basilensis]
MKLFDKTNRRCSWSETGACPTTVRLAIGLGALIAVAVLVALSRLKIG